MRLYGAIGSCLESGSDLSGQVRAPTHICACTTQQPAVVQRELAPLRILLVDDDPGLRGVLDMLLCAAGYAVTTAADGEAAWDALCTIRFDALITDHDMPRLTGLELLRRVRLWSMQLPLILMSGAMPRHDPEFARMLSPGLAIEKPFLMAEILVGLDALLVSVVRRSSRLV